MNRPDSTIQKLRPLIPNALSTNSNEIEAFQNTVIRPILKLQHEILLAHIEFDKNFVALKNIPSTKEAFLEKVKDLLLHNIALKNQLLGCTIGMMTVDELKVYHIDLSEYSKRIMSMIVKRVCG